MKRSPEELRSEIDRLRDQMREAQETLDAIRNGEVDAIVVSGKNGEQIFTLKGADHSYRILVEGMHDGAVSLAADGTILYCNCYFSKLLRVPMEQLMGQMFQPFVPAAQKPAFQTMFLKGLQAAVAGELALQRPDGKEVPVHLALSPVPVEEGRTLCLVVTDLSEYKHRQLEEINATLEQRVAERTALAEHRAVLLQKLAGQLSRTEEQERQRLGRIVHDHIQQLLVGAKFNTNVLSSEQDQAARRETLRQVDRLLDESLAACRSLTEELSPPVLYHGTLGQGLQWLAQRMDRKHDLSVRLELDGQANPPSEEVRILLFQAVRELLQNVIQHANVRQASVALSRLDATYIQVEVADQGTGFDPQAVREHGYPSRGLGLFRIRERLELLGGRMSIDSVPGRGTRITLVAPMDLAAAEPTGIAT